MRRHAGDRVGYDRPTICRDRSSRRGGNGESRMTDQIAVSNRPSGRMNGGRALAEMLRLADVGPMFGMGGFQLLPFYDALAQLGMRHFLINDERCGAFASDAYALCTNRPVVSDGTFGPGGTK